MNEANVKAAIKLMQKAESLQMDSWQGCHSDERNFVDTVDELHACGNTACFAGYLAISGLPGWGLKKGTAVPQFTGVNGKTWSMDEAVGEFLGISAELADAVVYGSRFERDDEMLYPVAFRQVTPKHVIAVLERILKGELQ